MVFTATIYPNKNQTFAVEVLSELIKKRPYTMNFVGEVSNPDYHEILQEKIASLKLEKYVNFVGSVDNVVLTTSLLKTYDIYFSPSLREMSPRGILEAKACGLPVVASHAFGQQDLINDGVDGLLYNDSDVMDAVEKIESIVNDHKKRESLGRQALNSCLHERGVFNAAKELEQFVNSLSRKK